MYLAAEERLFERYSVDVEMVELNDGHECWMAFAGGRLDAVVLPYTELSLENQLNANEAGVLMLLAAARPNPVSLALDSTQRQWPSDDLDVLVVSRGDLMNRRVEWQHVLHAYEHARLLLTASDSLHLQSVSDYEHRSVETIAAEIKNWNLFGVQQQDSLLSANGPFKNLKARWQGQFDVSTPAYERAAQRRDGQQANVPREKVR